MKKIIATMFMVLGLNAVYAQHVSVEKDLVGIQAGLLGVNIYNEHRLSDAITLRSDASLHGGFWTGDIYDKTGFLLAPAISIEPKWYYGLNRRVKKGKNISNNSGNYFSLRTEFSPNWFVISNDSNVSNDYNAISVIPVFGIRRSFSRNFNYEFNVGYGYSTTLGRTPNSKGGTFWISFKIGYDFFKR
ncbi:hypothetical protein [Capnocytophaga canis]|uniref:hypothetical protein n=1 Tax=Capnocytophaga canis TaxID=1848903 RepID=UPI001562B232|nr:hypothetical protein [Capnocytophaga canis]